MKSEYAGHEWVERAFKISNMSPLGKNVADLLGSVYRGIYHCDHHALKRTKWDDDYMVTFILSWQSLATYDGEDLTRLVVLSHDLEIRVELEAVAPHRIKMIFTQRQRNGDSISNRIPSIEDHIKRIRENQ